VVRRAFAALSALVISTGCSATGGGESLDGGADDTTPHVLDADEDAPPADAEVPPDDGDPDAGGDTSAIFDVDPDGCATKCAVCGEPDGCGGTCKTGSCVLSTETCVGGVCKCAPTCTTCGADDGCGSKCKTGSCPGTAACVSGTCVAPTKSYLSPSAYPSSWGAFARGIHWTIASEDPSTIRYTTDGSAPDATSASGASPLTISVPTDGTVLKWISDDGAKEGAQSFTVQISSSLQSNYGFVVDEMKLNGTSPVVVVSPGTVLNGSAKYQAWVGTGCPGCRQQLVYGVGNTAMGCLYDWSPGTWPGVSGTATTKITAPSTTGVHKVRVAWALEYSCADATTTANPLGVKPTADIATIVVK
jgi:hypothetical protein